MLSKQFLIKISPELLGFIDRAYKQYLNTIQDMPSRAEFVRRCIVLGARALTKTKKEKGL